MILQQDLMNCTTYENLALVYGGPPFPFGHASGSDGGGGMMSDNNSDPNGSQ